MATTSPILKFGLPEMDDGPNIEDSFNTLAKEIEKFVVMRFTDSSARSTAVTSPVAGMTSYLTGSNVLEVYDGSAWKTVARSTAWTTFTPTLITTGGALGNATIGGRWRRLGNTVDLNIQFIFGSTTSFGSGTIGFGSLPVAMFQTDFQVFPMWLYDTSVNNAFPGQGLSLSTTSIRPLSTAGNVTATVPFTWATGDFIVCNGRYEV